jgi:hypothetical protein
MPWPSASWMNTAVRCLRQAGSYAFEIRLDDGEIFRVPLTVAQIPGSVQLPGTDGGTLH